MSSSTSSSRSSAGRGLGVLALTGPIWSLPGDPTPDVVTAPAQEEADGGILDGVNDFFEPVDAFWGKYVNYYVGEVFFFDVWFWDNEVELDEAGNAVLDGYGREKIDKGTNLALAVVRAAQWAAERQSAPTDPSERTLSGASASSRA